MSVKICYLDTETTGLDARKCGIVQIAAILEIDGREVDTFDMRMRPAAGLEISDEALAVSGTKREDLEGFPTEREVYLAFLRWLGKHIDKFSKTDKALFAGYNSPFDVEFIRAWFDRCGDRYFGSWFWSGTVDVMGAALWALRDQRAALPNFKLGTVAAHVLGSRLDELTAELGLHNALTDIRVTRELHQRIRA
jgi:DNA polymerase-3 subunit epsilon